MKLYEQAIGVYLSTFPGQIIPIIVTPDNTIEEIHKKIMNAIVGLIIKEGV